MYTVKQVSELAGVSVRTLHYYDEIGLLHPSKIGANGYRYYDDDALLRLQQILLYREMEFELTHIKDILDDADFDTVSALRAHRTVLKEKIARLQAMVQTVDSTIMHVVGEVTMSKKRLFQPFSDEKQKEYEREIRLEYGPDIVNQSVRRYNSYTDAERQKIGDEGNRIYADLVGAIEAQLSPESEEVQAIMQRWHEHLRYFYEPTLEILRGLGDLYNDHPDFRANFAKLHENLAEYTRSAIRQYVDALEYAEIERMLAEDEDQERHDKR